MTSPFDPTPALEGALDIASPAAFDALLESIEDNGLWILDTEFERTDTYYPRLALIPSAVAGQVSLLDLKKKCHWKKMNWLFWIFFASCHHDKSYQPVNKLHHAPHSNQTPHHHLDCLHHNSFC